MPLTITLDLPLGVELAYLRGPIKDRWEALVRLPLPPEHENTLRFAVGFGSAFHPNFALSAALAALASDSTIEEQELHIPTCAPPDDMAERLSNLLTPSAITLSPPAFKLKVL